MSAEQVPEDRILKLLRKAGIDLDKAVISRRQWPRFEARGIVEFSRPQEKARHTGTLLDVSEGGLAFVTDVSLAVGETLHMVYSDEDEPRAREAMVETVHSHPKETQYLVGARFIPRGEA